MRDLRSYSVLRLDFASVNFFATSISWLLLCSLSMAEPTAKLVEAPQGVRALLDVPYVSEGHKRQKLDLYLPEPPDQTPRPLLLKIHGGAWRHGDKQGQRSVANYVKKGYVAVAINYRFSQQALFPAQIEDCKSAVRWLRAHAPEYGIDTKKFVVMGASAGGHLAALLGTTGDVKDFDVGENLEFPSSVQAVVDSYGPTDFQVAINTPGYGKRLSAITQLLGGPVDQHLKLAESANPITYISKSDPPFLILHGDADPLVPINQSQLLHAALKQAGVPVEFHTVEGGGHGGEAFKTQEIRKIVKDFLEDLFCGS